MYTQFPRLILTTGIALAITSITNAALADTPAQELTEARQETQIWTTYALSPYLRANDIKVSVNNGTATLTGNVEENVNKELAKQIALGVNGVKAVDNQIVVRADYVPHAKSTTRSYADVVDDATITAAIRSKLLWSKDTNGLSTDVQTKYGKVILSGTADSSAGKELAGRLAMNTRGVTAVDNQLAIKTVKTAGKAPSSDIADSWITTKVKSTYLYSTNVDGGDISVSTSSGIVTLAGKVDSGAERALAIELADNVRGVKSVSSKGLTL